MMNNNLNEIADKFISTRRYDKAELTKKIQILLKVYYGNNGSYTFDAEVFAESVRDAVKGYTSNKDTLINVS